MLQSRICSFYNHHCSHASREPKRFPHLPEDIRHRIYLNAGLLNDGTLCLRIANRVPCFSHAYCNLPATQEFLENLGKCSTGVLVLGPACCFDPCEINIYLNLRLVSRTVSDDAARCISHNNTIVVGKADIPTLTSRALPQPPLQLLSWLRRITIDLSRSQIYNPPSLDRQRDFVIPAEFQRVWVQFISIIARSTGSQKLDLKLIHDIEEEDADWLSIEPLETLTLAKCTLRVSDRPNEKLKDIARSAVHYITRTDPILLGCFRFLDLPTELRQHILSFTHVVVPHDGIEWCSQFKFHLIGWHRSDRSLCSDFCARSAVYPACACWTSPTTLFMVSRLMLQDASTTFFSSNRFVIDDSEGSERHLLDFRPKPSEKPFDASTFLRQIVPLDSLAHLRDLEIAMPGKDHDFLSVDPKAIDKWESTIQYVAPHLKRLTLTARLGVAGRRSSELRQLEGFQASLKRLFQANEPMVRPLSQLQCLNAFFVRARSPFGCSQWAMGEVETSFRKHEQHLEALVMGSAYDSHKHGKPNDG